MFRGKTTISYDDYHKFINDIDELSYESKKILLELTPETYIGNSKIINY